MPFVMQNDSVRMSALEGTPVAYSVYPMRSIDAKFLWTSMRESGASPDDPCDVVLKQEDPFGLRHFAHLIVDLTATDEEIIENFQSWLEQQRNLLGPEGRPLKFTQGHFNKWIADQLLPFIDLTLWARSIQRNIPHRAMGEILSVVQDERDIELRDRRTVEKNADALLQWSLIAALHAQANQEAS